MEPQIVQQKLYFRCPKVYNALVANDDLSCQLFPHADLPASDIFLHERYDPGSLRNDIALIRYCKFFNISFLLHFLTTNFLLGIKAGPGIAMIEHSSLDRCPGLYGSGSSFFRSKGIRTGSRDWMKNYTNLKLTQIFLLKSKVATIWSLGLHEDIQATGEAASPQKRTSNSSKREVLCPLFHCLRSLLPSWIRIRF
jgi:hypothetical protein